jgi:hypothetical protein
MNAKGTFEVKLSKLQPYNIIAEAKLGRMSIDKEFSGDLQAVSKGEMLSAFSNTEGSAGYVAIEEVEGILQGKEGTFILQHNATMTRNKQELNIIVVPDSGTGELKGLIGRMQINIIDGKHFYDFDYNISTE